MRLVRIACGWLWQNLQIRVNSNTCDMPPPPLPDIPETPIKIHQKKKKNPLNLLCHNFKIPRDL